MSTDTVHHHDVIIYGTGFSVHDRSAGTASHGGGCAFGLRAATRASDVEDHE